jgi:hypothetical protein
MAEPPSDAAAPKYSSRRPREAAEQIAANPRRGRWLRGGNYEPEISGSNTQKNGLTNVTGTEPKLQPTPARLPTTTILRAGEGKPPNIETDSQPLELPD